MDLNGWFPEFFTNIHAFSFLCLGDFYALRLDLVENNTLFDPCSVGDPFNVFDFNCVPVGSSDPIPQNAGSSQEMCMR